MCHRYYLVLQLVSLVLVLILMLMRHLTITTLEIYHQVTTGVQISPRKYLLDRETPAQSVRWSVLLLGNFSLLRLILASQGHLMGLCARCLLCSSAAVLLRAGKKQPGPLSAPPMSLHHSVGGDGEHLGAVREYHGHARCLDPWMNLRYLYCWPLI